MARRSKGFWNSFKSGLEYIAGDFLRVREKEFGYVSRYEPEKLAYILTGTYKPDFVLTFNDGRKIYIETKGYMDNDARRKMVAVKKANPELDIRMVFAKDNKLRPTSIITYMGWAQKVGFPAALKSIPEEWLKPPGEQEECQSGVTTPLQSTTSEDVDTNSPVDGTG